MNILAIIPARSGSKSVKDKNIRLINGKPMLAYSIEHALASKYINRVILSTDSEKYAEIGRQYGAEVPFIRPAEFATDTALDIDVFKHALSFLKESEGYEADIVVQLRPTYPKRNAADIDAMIELLLENPDADSVRSVAPAEETPYKMWRLEADGKSLKPLLTDVPEGYNSPRQALPKVYSQNACIDVVRASVITEKNSMTGDRILGFIMDENLDIDTEEQLSRANEALKESQEAASKASHGANGTIPAGKRFVFDIDGVIARLTPDNNYAVSEPNIPVIEVINSLYEAGNEIILHTARGYVTGKDWKEITVKQLEAWGLKYHELLFGKPNADYYVDDKALYVEDLLKRCF